MASGENQGLQIAIIILFIVVICLAMGTFMFFNQANQYTNLYNAEKAKLEERNKQLEVAVADVDKLKQYIGLPEDADLAKAEQTFTEDKAKYFATLPADNQFYRQALEGLSATVLKLQEEKNAALAKNTELEAVNEGTRTASKKEVDEAIAARKKAEEELADEKTKFMTAQKEADAQKKDLSDQIAKLQQDFAVELDKQNKSIEDLNKKIALVTKGRDEVQKKYEGTKPQHGDLDDGEILQVVARDNTVWLNIGSADGLRPQTTFSVHGPNVSPIDEAAKKGTIEVTRIMGEHMAEARITSIGLRELMLPGDKIYTPLWDPGRRERFAIVGRIDLDGDGEDDRGKLKSIIEMAGGVIDAEVDNEGKTTGKISVETRYVIAGPAAAKAQNQIDKLLAEAKSLSVEEIGLDRFLDYIGYKQTLQTARYGIGSDVSNMPYARNNSAGRAVAAGGYNDMFKARRPTRLPGLDGDKSDEGDKPAAPRRVNFGPGGVQVPGRP